MRREHLYLQDILEACDLIQTFLAGLDASAFLASELHKAATLQKLAVIGEAAARLRKHFVRHTRRWNGVILSRSAILPSMHILRCNGILYGQRPLMMFRFFGVRFWRYSKRKT